MKMFCTVKYTPDYQNLVEKKVEYLINESFNVDYVLNDILGILNKMYH